jgi:hypothetical protein
MALKVPKAGGPDLFKAGYKVSLSILLRPSPVVPPVWKAFMDLRSIMRPSPSTMISLLTSSCSTCPVWRSLCYGISLRLES